jgi:hypothetical protein
MAAPVSPRCGSSKYVVLRAPGLQPLSWSCHSCRFKIEHLSRAVLIWRLWEELDRITREAA